MNTLNTKIKSAIDMLCKAVPEIEQYDQACDSKTFVKLAKRYGPIAYHVYKALNTHENPIYLDPWLVCNRYRSADGGLPDTAAFWIHPDAVTGLVKALDRMGFIPKELTNASS